MKSPKRKILFSPLNWGLGHAIRSVPILKSLSREGFEIIFAANGLTLEVLRKEFPSWSYFEIPSFQMKYSSGSSQVFSVLKSLPSIVYYAFRDHILLQSLIKENKVDIVVSDNRFGFFSKRCISVYITHQLTVRMPIGFRFLEPVVRWLHKSIISCYTYCWIPDEPGCLNLSGELSHIRNFPSNVRFIGVLSRFQKDKQSLNSIKLKKYNFLFLLSGVEPQRTMLEKKILSFFKRETGYNALLIRGVTENTPNLFTDSNELFIKNQVSGDELRKIITDSEVVVCRSGYTSIMELCSLSQCSILIPTSGQPEQEYLAEYVSKYPLFTFINQDNLTFLSLLEAKKRLNGYLFPFSSVSLNKAIEELKSKI